MPKFESHYSGETLVHVHKEKYIRMFTITLFVISKEVNTILESLVREGINNWLSSIIDSLSQFK